MMASAQMRARPVRGSYRPASEQHRIERRRLVFSGALGLALQLTGFEQRAFRQRKEGYIKKLEEQVKDYQTMEQNYRALQAENYQLREYILNLQSRLLESQSDIPPAPTHINLSAGAQPPRSEGDQPATAAEHQLRREMESERTAHDGMSQLQAAAAQASEAAQPQEPPYGLGSKRPRAASSADGKAGT